MRMMMLAIFSAILFASPAWAADCGGAVVCRCGDTVTTSYVMPASLACPTGHGLRVADGRTLNCAGFSITGASLDATYGIYLDQTDNATVSNCGVYYFHRGIRLNNAHGNVIQNTQSAVNGNMLTHVGVGVDFAGGSSGNRLLTVSSIGNADEGIHVGPGANENIIYSGEVCGNFRENLYFLDNRDNTVHSVNAGHSCYGFVSGSNAVYMRDTTHNHFMFNVFRERSVHVTGDAVGTVLFNNTFQSGAVYKESCYAPTGRCPYLTIKTP
jgi:parallel beta-helix repeat protein